MDRIIAGTNPYLVDLTCAAITGHNYHEIKYLEEGLKQGKLLSEDLEVVSKITPVAVFKKAKANPVVQLTSLRHLIWLRDLLRPIYDMPAIAWILYLLRIREDIFDQSDDHAVITGRDINRCNGCGRCLEFCPLGLPISDKMFDFEMSDCINCLYCFFCCPQDAIYIKGDPGYLFYLIRKYKPKTKQI
jgi:ferredoxin